MAAVTHGRHWPRPEEADDEPESTPVGEHTHRQPRLVLVGLTAIVVLLLVSNGLTLLYGVSVNNRLTATEEFIAGRGEQRDAENERLNQRVDQAVCDVLDRLPAGELFDPARAEYGCGPGIPLDQLDPAAAQNLADILGSVEAAQPAQASAAPAAEPEATSAPDEMPPGAPPGARPSPMGQPPTTAPTPTQAPVPTPAAPTSDAPIPAPLVDLTPLTDPVCALLGVCL